MRSNWGGIDTVAINLAYGKMDMVQMGLPIWENQIVKDSVAACFNHHFYIT